MKYTVLKHFRDLQDDGYVYHEGDNFPREGLSVSQERIDELSSNGNKRCIPLIAEVKNPEEVSQEAPKETPKKAPAKSRGKKKG